MDIQRISNNTVQQIIDAFTQSLLDGTLKPGDQIPTEVELSEKFGVARNTVRESIKILVAMGVLEIRRPVGTFVCQGFNEAMISPMLYGVILGRGDSYDELMDLREIMETGTMLTVIRNASDEEIATLSRPLVALGLACRREAPVVEEVFSRDDDFHEAMMALTHNRILERIAATVRTMTHDMRHESVELMLTSNRAEELYQAHEKLYRILSERDVDGVYREIRSTYFVPDENRGVAPLSEKR
ncbi:MAG: FadR family transcriptional regulator [Oscillospiraceae bacterium]|nr:FadR family transcriptional regulator [Oscillospiraceae bacterium]